MSLTLQYSDPRGIDEPAALVSLGSNVRYGQFRVTMSAELGEPAMSTIDIEDPGGFYNLVGLRAFDSRETSAPSNNSMIGRFVMQDRVIGRDKERALLAGSARLWTVDLTDYNWHLSSRIHTDADAKRPVETAGDRIRWLLTNALHINLNDYGNVAYPTTAMDATDYRGQRARDLLADCAVESGYNFWCDFNEAAGKPELFFLDPNGTSYESDIAVSNVMADVDNLVTFYPSMDAEVRRSVSRLTYGVYLAYANGAVYVRNDTVGAQFGTIDQTAPMSNVKTRARALRIANKFLSDNDEEDDRITFEIIVPRAQVNDVRHGHRMSARFQHIPGYETPMWVRIVKKSVIQDEDLGDDYYRVAMEAVPTGDSVPYSAACALIDVSLTAAGTYEGNHSQVTQEPGNLFYLRAGIPYPYEPEVGFVGAWHFPTYELDYAGAISANFARVIVAGPGVLTMTVGIVDGSFTFWAKTYYIDGSGPNLLSEVSGLAPGAHAFTISDDIYCYHYVDIGDEGLSGNWQFGGWTWDPA